MRQKAGVGYNRGIGPFPFGGLSVRTINRYILRQIWVPALLALVVIGFVVIGGAIQEETQDLLREVPTAPITLWDIGRISFYSSPMLVGFVLPITFLMGIMLTFGNMARHNEITALKAAGIPLRRLVVPVLWMGAVLGVICFAVQDGMQPWAYRKLQELVNSDLPLRATLDVFPKGVMRRYGNWRVYIGNKTEDGVLEDIVVLQEMPGGQVKSFYAKQAWLEPEGDETRLVMEDGLIVDAERGGFLPHTAFRERSWIRVPTPSKRDYQLEHQAMSVRQVLASCASLANEHTRTKNVVVMRKLYDMRLELGERLAFPVMCLAVAFVAAPLGVRAKRSGRSYTFVSGFAIVGAYFVLRTVATPGYLPEVWDAVLRAQVPNLVLLLAGAVLLWRVDRV